MKFRHVSLWVNLKKGPRDVWSASKRSPLCGYDWVEDRVKVWTREYGVIGAWYYVARYYIRDVLNHAWWVHWEFPVGDAVYYRKMPWYEFPWSQPNWTPWAGCVGGGHWDVHPFPCSNMTLGEAKIFKHEI